MKAVILLAVLALLATSVSAVKNLDGVWLDNRFGSTAYICTPDHISGLLGTGIQATASAKVFFWSSDSPDGIFSGEYVEAGPVPRSGTFWLKANDVMNTLQGWYYPDDDPVGSGWPWSLTLSDPTDPDPMMCLYLNHSSNSPYNINSEWSGQKGSLSICSEDQGALSITGGGSYNDAYLYGQQWNNLTFYGRQVLGTPPSDPKAKPITFCNDTQAGNALLRVVTSGSTFELAGWLHQSNIISPPNAQWVRFDHSGNEDVTCGSSSKALQQCDNGEVGGPIYRPLRSAGAGVFVSVAVLLVSLLAFFL